MSHSPLSLQMSAFFAYLKRREAELVAAYKEEYPQQCCDGSRLDEVRRTIKSFQGYAYAAAEEEEHDHYMAEWRKYQSETSLTPDGIRYREEGAQYREEDDS